MGLIQVASLGLSLLKAALERADIPCGVRYFNLELVDQFLSGPPDTRAGSYVHATERYQVAFLCEAMFAERLFGPDAARDSMVARQLAAATPDERAFVLGVRDAAPLLLEHCLRSVDWESVRILGLSSVFLGMTAPSALLARIVKERYPHVVTVLGGPNTEGPMGEALLEQLPSIDYVLRGEADVTFPALVRALLDGDDPGGLPGLVRRGEGGRIEAWRARPVTDMDALPLPDFDDFVRAARATSFAPRYERHLQLPFESSRGCWWGEVSHCKFCGINGDGMAFRAKSDRRVLDEVGELVKRYRPETLVASDAILDRSYFASMLPSLAAGPVKVGLSYEVKASLKRPQMAALAAAGVVEILPGIETFSTRILKLIAKGTTALDNLLCLRLAEEYGVRTSWYHMCGLPFETSADYEQEALLLRRISHLPPPREIARFTLQRFTPYFQRARAEGIDRVRALSEYRAVFPFEPEVLDRIAYHFEFDFADGRASDETARIEALLGSVVEAWQSAYGRARLDLHVHRGGALIVDLRETPATIYVLAGGAAVLYEHIDRPHTASAILRAPGVQAAHAGSVLDSVFGEPEALKPLLECAARLAALHEAEIVQVSTPFLFGIPTNAAEARRRLVAFLDALCEHGLAYTELNRYLALAVPRSRPADYAAWHAEPPVLEVLA